MQAARTAFSVSSMTSRAFPARLVSDVVEVAHQFSEARRGRSDPDEGPGTADPLLLAGVPAVISKAAQRHSSPHRRDRPRADRERRPAGRAGLVRAAERRLKARHHGDRSRPAVRPTTSPISSTPYSAGRNGRSQVRSSRTTCGSPVGNSVNIRLGNNGRVDICRLELTAKGAAVRKVPVDVCR